MKRRILALVVALALVALVVPAAVFAVDTGTVSCTVSAVLVLVTVSDGSVDYGTVNVGATQNTTSSGVSDTQTATNDGSAIENFNIKSSDAAGAVNWTLAGTQDADEFTHKFSKDSGSSWTAMPADHSYTSLAIGIAKDSTQTFDLQIGMPTSATDYGTHNITVTVQAVQG